jgi:hypothetical protein
MLTPEWLARAERLAVRGIAAETRAAAATLVVLAADAISELHSNTVDVEAHFWHAARERCRLVADAGQPHRCLAVGLQLCGRFVEAFAVYKEVLNAEPTRADIFCDAAQMWLWVAEAAVLEAESIDCAITWLVATSPRFAADECGDIAVLLGRLLLCQGKQYEARIVLTRAISVCANDVSCCFALAEAHVQLDALDAASAVLTAAHLRGVDFDRAADAFGGEHPIVVAISHELARLVELLVDVGGASAQRGLVRAAQQGSCEIIRALCQRGATATLMLQESALVTAVACDHVEAFEVLLATDTAQTLSAEFLSALIGACHSAARVSRCKASCAALQRAIRLLLEQGYQLVAGAGASCMQLAARCGCAPTMRLIRELSRDALYGSAKQFSQLLAGATSGGSAQVFELVIKWGTFRRRQVSEAVTLAAELGRVEIVRWLRSHGLFDPFIANENGSTVLQSAAKGGSELVVRWVLAADKAKRMLNERSANDYPPIFLAAQFGHRGAVHALAFAGARPDDDYFVRETGAPGAWPSMRRAAQYRRTDTLLLLLAAAPGDFASKPWLPMFVTEAHCRASTSRHLVALFLAAGAPQTEAVRQLIASDTVVCAAVDQAATQLHNERHLAKRSFAKFAFADTLHVRVTDVALALSALQLPVLVVVNIILLEHIELRRVPFFWLWDRVARVQHHHRRRSLKE